MRGNFGKRLFLRHSEQLSNSVFDDKLDEKSVQSARKYRKAVITSPAFRESTPDESRRTTSKSKLNLPQIIQRSGSVAVPRTERSVTVSPLPPRDLTADSG